jgi:regulator of RNase E activity RraA
VGDEDGLVSFSPTVADELIAAARRSAIQEGEVRDEIRTGRVDQSWIRRALDPHGL